MRIWSRIRTLSLEVEVRPVVSVANSLFRSLARSLSPAKCLYECMRMPVLICKSNQALFHTSPTQRSLTQDIQDIFRDPTMYCRLFP